MDPLDQQSPSGSGIKHSVVVDKPPKLPGHKSSGGSGGSTSSGMNSCFVSYLLTLVRQRSSSTHLPKLKHVI